MSSDAPLYLILDMETTGLDHRQDMILEVAWALTDNLEEAGRAPVYSMPVRVDVAAAAQQANAYVRKMHTDNFLWDVLEHEDIPKGTLEEIEDAIIRLIHARRGGFERPVHLVGNSIGSLDLPFIREKMPLLAQRLHYRVIDLTSVNLLIQGIGGPDTKVREEDNHRAADDVRLTIKQLANQRAVILAGIAPKGQGF